MQQAHKVLDAIEKKHAISFSREEYDVSGIAIDNHGCHFQTQQLQAVKNLTRYFLVLSAVLNGNTFHQTTNLNVVPYFRYVNTSNCSAIYVHTQIHKGLESFSPLRADAGQWLRHRRCS